MTSCLRHFLHKRPQCFHLSITLHLRRTYDGKLRDIYVRSGRDRSLFPGECLKAKWIAGSWVKTQLILALYFSTKSYIQKYLWTVATVPSTGRGRRYIIRWEPVHPQRFYSGSLAFAKSSQLFPDFLRAWPCFCFSRCLRFVHLQQRDPLLEWGLTPPCVSRKGFTGSHQTWTEGAHPHTLKLSLNCYFSKPNNPSGHRAD